MPSSKSLTEVELAEKKLQNMQCCHRQYWWTTEAICEGVYREFFDNQVENELYTLNIIINTS